ncbi:MAG: response regulator [Patescibacteria group bacterium]|nr:response regulator [Patescibacteria group bacterium]
MRTKEQESKTVFVVDDCLMILDIYKHFFTTLGYEIVTAETGYSAIAEFEQRQNSGQEFCLAVIDFSLPDMKGSKLIKELSRLNPAIKALIVSGYTSDDVMENPQAYGFVGSMKKPFGLQELKNSIEAVLLPA